MCFSSNKGLLKSIFGQIILNKSMRILSTRTPVYLLPSPYINSTHGSSSAIIFTGERHAKEKVSHSAQEDQ